MDAAQGRGWLVLNGDELKGRLYIHHGDEWGSCSHVNPEEAPQTEMTADVGME